MVYLLILNLAGFITSLLIGLNSCKGYRVTLSPTMLRLCIAFLSLSITFLFNAINLHSITFISTVVAYFFLAYAYNIQTSFKHMVPLLALITFAISPFFNISGNVVEYVSRAVAFILVVYGSTQSMVIALPKVRINSFPLFVSIGLSLLALGEFVSWYALIFTDVIIYSYASVALKVSGLALIYVTMHVLSLKRLSSSSNQ